MKSLFISSHGGWTESIRDCLFNNNLTDNFSRFVSSKFLPTCSTFPKVTLWCKSTNFRVSVEFHQSHGRNIVFLIFIDIQPNYLNI